MERQAGEKGNKIRILIVDDHPIVREGIALFLNHQDDRHGCTEAANAEEALAAMQADDYALAIVDISLNGDSGLNLIRILRQRYPKLAILVVSMHEELQFAERALRAGANGYLMKQEGTQNILQAVRQVLGGNVYLSAAMQSSLSHRLMAPQGDWRGPIAGLSEREFEILHLISLGLGTREIAEKLNRSIKTIEAHRASIKEKLQLGSGRELERFAVQWLEPDSTSLILNGRVHDK